MYAIVAHGGHQYRVSPGERLLVDRLVAEVGDTVELSPVLFLGEEEGKAGKLAKGDVVKATVVSHHRGPKIRIFTYKAKKRSRRTMGHRSNLTELEVQSVGAHTAKEKTPAAKASKKKEPKDGS